MLFTAFFVAMSLAISPLVKYGYGFEDEWVANTMILCTNCFLWESVGCEMGSGLGLIFTRLLLTCVVAVLFFIMITWSKFEEKHTVRENTVTNGRLDLYVVNQLLIPLL